MQIKKTAQEKICGATNHPASHCVMRSGRRRFPSRMPKTKEARSS